MNKNSYKRFIVPIYILNTVIQSLVTLLSPIGVMLLLAWLLDKKAGVGAWIYVVLIMIGVFLGLYSMVVFVLRSSRAIEAIEKQNSAKKGGSYGKK